MLAITACIVIRNLLVSIRITFLNEVKMSLIVTGDEQTVCKILSTTIKIIASHTLRPELAPSKILENLLYHKSFICQVLQKRPAFPQDVSKNMEVILTDQNARIRTGGSLLRLMLPPAGETFCQLPVSCRPAAINQIKEKYEKQFILPEASAARPFGSILF